MNLPWDRLADSQYTLAKKALTILEFATFVFAIISVKSVVVVATSSENKN